MILAKFSTHLIAISLIIILDLIAVMGVGCGELKLTGTIANELAATMFVYTSIKGALP